MRFLMRTIAAWPGRELGEHVWKVTAYYIYYLHVQALSAVIPLLYYLILNAKKLPFVILGDRCISFLLPCTGMLRMTVLCLRKDFREFGKLFFTKMHLIYFKDKSEYAMKIYRQVHRLSERCTVYLVFMLATSLTFFNVGPIFVNYSDGLFSEEIPENSSKVYALAAYYSFPFECDYLTNFKIYVIVSLFTCYISYFTAVCISILDLYLYVIVFHIWGHYKILIHNLRTIPKPISLDKYTAQESDQVNEMLKDCIKYHNLITEFLKMMSKAFGPSLLLYAGFMLSSNCLLLLECTYEKETLMRFGPLFLFILLDLLQFGLVFELIGTAGDDLKTQVYDVPWEYMNTNNRKIVLFMLMNVQKSVRVKAMGILDLGVATVASILKTSFSYFTFMRTIK